MSGQADQRCTLPLEEIDKGEPWAPFLVGFFRLPVKEAGAPLEEVLQRQRSHGLADWWEVLAFILSRDYEAPFPGDSGDKLKRAQKLEAEAAARIFGSFAQMLQEICAQVEQGRIKFPEVVSELQLDEAIAEADFLVALVLFAMKRDIEIQRRDRWFDDSFQPVLKRPADFLASVDQAARLALLPRRTRLSEDVDVLRRRANERGVLPGDFSPSGPFMSCVHAIGRRFGKSFIKAASDYCCEHAEILGTTKTSDRPATLKRLVTQKGTFEKRLANYFSNPAFVCWGTEPIYEMIFVLHADSLADFSDIFSGLTAANSDGATFEDLIWTYQWGGGVYPAGRVYSEMKP